MVTAFSRPSKLGRLPATDNAARISLFPSLRRAGLPGIRSSGYQPAHRNRMPRPAAQRANQSPVRFGRRSPSMNFPGPTNRRRHNARKRPSAPHAWRAMPHPRRAPTLAFHVSRIHNPRNAADALGGKDADLAGRSHGSAFSGRSATRVHHGAASLLVKTESRCPILPLLLRCMISKAPLSSQGVFSLTRHAQSVAARTESIAHRIAAWITGARAARDWRHGRPDRKSRVDHSPHCRTRPLCRTRA